MGRHSAQTRDVGSSVGLHSAQVRHAESPVGFRSEQAGIVLCPLAW